MDSAFFCILLILLSSLIFLNHEGNLVYPLKVTFCGVLIFICIDKLCLHYGLNSTEILILGISFPLVICFLLSYINKEIVDYFLMVYILILVSMKSSLLGWSSEYRTIIRCFKISLIKLVPSIFTLVLIKTPFVNEIISVIVKRNVFDLCYKYFGIDSSFSFSDYFGLRDCAVGLYSDGAPVESFGYFEKQTNISTDDLVIPDVDFVYNITEDLKIEVYPNDLNAGDSRMYRFVKSYKNRVQEDFNSFMNREELKYFVLSMEMWDKHLTRSGFISSKNLIGFYHSLSLSEIVMQINRNSLKPTYFKTPPGKGIKNPIFAGVPDFVSSIIILILMGIPLAACTYSQLHEDFLIAVFLTGIEGCGILMSIITILPKNNFCLACKVMLFRMFPWKNHRIYKLMSNNINSWNFCDPWTGMVREIHLNETFSCYYGSQIDTFWEEIESELSESEEISGKYTFGDYNFRIESSKRGEMTTINCSDSYGKSQAFYVNNKRLKSLCTFLNDWHDKKTIGLLDNDKRLLSEDFVHVLDIFEILEIFAREKNVFICTLKNKKPLRFLASTTLQLQNYEAVALETIDCQLGSKLISEKVFDYCKMFKPDFSVIDLCELFSNKKVEFSHPKFGNTEWKRFTSDIIKIMRENKIDYFKRFTLLKGMSICAKKALERSYIREIIPFIPVEENAEDVKRRKEEAVIAAEEAKNKEKEIHLKQMTELDAIETEFTESLPLFKSIKEGMYFVSSYPDKNFLKLIEDSKSAERNLYFARSEKEEKKYSKKVSDLNSTIESRLLQSPHLINYKNDFTNEQTHFEYMKKFYTGFFKSEKLELTLQKLLDLTEIDKKKGEKKDPPSGRIVIEEGKEKEFKKKEGETENKKNTKFDLSREKCRNPLLLITEEEKAEAVKTLNTLNIKNIKSVFGERINILKKKWSKRTVRKFNKRSEFYSRNKKSMWLGGRNTPAKFIPNLFSFVRSRLANGNQNKSVSLKTRRENCPQACYSKFYQKLIDSRISKFSKREEESTKSKGKKKSPGIMIVKIKERAIEIKNRFASIYCKTSGSFISIDERILNARRLNDDTIKITDISNMKEVERLDINQIKEKYQI